MAPAALGLAVLLEERQLTTPQTITGRRFPKSSEEEVLDAIEVHLRSTKQHEGTRKASPREMMSGTDLWEKWELVRRWV